MTRNQRSKLKLKKNKKLSLELKISKGKPQIKGLTLKVFTMTPKKPNSALRKVAKVKLSTGLGPRNQKIITAYIPGEKHTLSIHNYVLVIPGKKQDLPGIKYRIVRGVLDSK